MAQPSPTYRLLDHILPDGIETFVRARRDNGMSWRKVALAIRDEAGVDVTFETVRSWFIDADGAAA